MTDLRQTIAPKSDQINADDLIGGGLTIKVSKVSLCSEADQPIAINFEGDNGKPYKPCKSMRRVLVNVWGPDGNAFVGRSMTLYRDDKVMFGGLAVGGIRISHLSNIDRDVTMALTATRANRKPFTVRPLATPAPDPTPTERKRSVRELLRDRLHVAVSRDDVADARAMPAVAKILREGPEEQRLVLQQMLDEAFARFPDVGPADDEPDGEYGHQDAAE